MSSKGKRWVLREDGTWEEGKAQPKLLREDLRKLPSHWVTEETADGSKIHEVDPPHVVETIRDELAEAETAEQPNTYALQALIELADAPLSDPVVPLNQWRVDAVRLRAIFALIERANLSASRKKPVDLEVRHLRFPMDNVHKYELHLGNPPRNKELRKHERGLQLWVDPFNWPRRLAEKLREAGVDVPELGMEKSQYREYRLKLSEARMLDAGL
jgi:hypothetical protein